MDTAWALRFLSLSTKRYGKSSYCHGLVFSPTALYLSRQQLSGPFIMSHAPTCISQPSLWPAAKVTNTQAHQETREGKVSGPIRSTNYMLSTLWGALHKSSPLTLPTIPALSIPQNPGGRKRASGWLVRRRKSHSRWVLADLRSLQGTTDPWVGDYARQAFRNLFCSNPLTSLMPWIPMPIPTPLQGWCFGMSVNPMGFF